MRVGIIQSSYIPWRGYFDFISQVDLFVVFDDIPISNGRSWRNRNQVKLATGLRWITVPLREKTAASAIDEVCIANVTPPWEESHRNLLRESLRPTPYFDTAMALWEEGVAGRSDRLSELNFRFIQILCRHLGISTPLVRSRDLGATGAKTDRLLDILKRVGGSTYVSGPVASDYLEVGKFRDAGIRLEYKSYDYPPYPQPHGEFAGTVTVLDLIANTGPEAPRYLHSRNPNTVVVT